MLDLAVRNFRLMDVDLGAGVGMDSQSSIRPQFLGLHE